MVLTCIVFAQSP